MPAQPGVAGGVGAAVRLDDGSVEAHGAPPVDLDERPQVVVRTLPALALAVEVPQPAHAHVGVQDDAVVPLDLEVLAVALDRLDHPPGPGRDPDEPRRLEPDHLLVDQRRPQRRGRPVDGVALRHCTAHGRSPPPSGGCRPWPDPANCSGRPPWPPHQELREPSLRQLADVGEGEADQAVVAAGHLAAHRRADRFGRAEPGEVEGLLRRLAVAVDRHDVGQRHGVVPGVVEPERSGSGKYSTIVNGVGSAGRRGRASGPRSFSRWRIRRVAHPLAEQHPAADDHPADRAVGGHPQQHADLGHPPEPVDAHRDGVDVHEGHVRPHQLEVLGRQPAGRRSRWGCRSHSWSSGADSRTAPLPSTTATSVSATLRRVHRSGHEGGSGEAAHRSGRQLPVHGDADLVRPRQRARDLRATERRLRSVPSGVPPLRVEGRRAGADAPADRRGADAPRPPVLDRRPGVRPRLPHPPHEPGAARSDRPARRPDRPHRRPTDGSHPPAVGGVRHRGPGGRQLGAAHEVPPRHDRRRVGRPA